MLSATSRAAIFTVVLIIVVMAVFCREFAVLLVIPFIPVLGLLYVIYWRNQTATAHISLDRIISMQFFGGAAAILTALILLAITEAVKKALQLNAPGFTGFVNEEFHLPASSKSIWDYALLIFYLLVEAFLFAGLIEEGCKALIARMPTYMRRSLGHLDLHYVDNPLSTVLSFVAVAAGFSIIENGFYAYIKYTSSSGLQRDMSAAFTEVAYRSFVCLPLHCLCAAMSALRFVRIDYYDYMSAFSAIAPSVFVHGSYNAAAFLAEMFFRPLPALIITLCVGCAINAWLLIHVIYTYQKIDVRGIAENFQKEEQEQHSIEAGKKKNTFSGSPSYYAYPPTSLASAKENQRAIPFASVDSAVMHQYYYYQQQFLQTQASMNKNVMSPIVDTYAPVNLQKNNRRAPLAPILEQSAARSTTAVVSTTSQNEAPPTTGAVVSSSQEVIYAQAPAPRIGDMLSPIVSTYVPAG